MVAVQRQDRIRSVAFLSLATNSHGCRRVNPRGEQEAGRDAA